MSQPSLTGFVERVCCWQRAHGRRHLPWQQTHDPYRIWLSEIMLQQTQVSTVIPYYERFLERFPDIAALAVADQEDVMPYWAGLGYYARARNLHRCAREIMDKYGGRFPPDSQRIAELPGIGRSTAAAIAAFAYGERSPIMDGNVKRVFARHFAVRGQPGQAAVERRLWELAERALEEAGPDVDMTAYTQGLMDLGAQVCTRGTPECSACPIGETCEAKRLGLQQTLPEPRPRKQIPERRCTMLLLHRNGSVLLEKQPEPGIWGGLWSLPRFDTPEALAAACLHMGAVVTPAGRMASFMHVFSHFRLEIEPWLVEAGPDVAEPQPGRRWVSATELPVTAMPAPVRSLLEGVFSGDRSQAGGG